MKKIYTLLLLLYCMAAFSQEKIQYPYSNYFSEAYQLYPDVPKGLLEAVAYSNTHIRHITPQIEPASCSGMPFSYGVMGLVLDGKNYFRENLKKVSTLSGIATQEIISSPRKNILAYSAAYQNLVTELSSNIGSAQEIMMIVSALSELNIISETAVNDYTMNLYLYGLFVFLNDRKNQQEYDFPAYYFNLKDIFGEENLKIFQSKRVNVSGGSVSTEAGQTYSPLTTRAACPDYVRPNCSWIASPNHYTGWNGHTISAIAMHTVQGSYTSCINWFQNTDANASTHYVVASHSSYAGQVTQMVNEDNAGWHVTSQNWYAIGYEHEGWVNDPTWYDATMYQTSADLTRDICTRNGIDPLRMFYRDTLDDGTVLNNGLHSLGGETACVKIKGHQHFFDQTHTDPGPNWNWNLYFKLVNNSTPVTTYATTTGSFYDSGGSTGNYTNDERKFWLIQPTGAQSVTLTFTQFALESNYDFMYIYNGANEFAPLIGRYNTISPGTIVSTGGSLFIEFRSDCATPAAGWAATWTTSQSDIVSPVTAVSSSSKWVNSDFPVQFTDADNIGGSGVDKKYYQVIDYNGSEWRGNKTKGFFNDNFNISVNPDWTINSGGGTWSINSGHLFQSDSVASNTNIYSQLAQTSGNGYMYHWKAMMDGNTANRRCGIHFFVSNPALANRGISYLAWFRADDDKVQIYKISGDTLYTKADNPLVINTGVWYDFKVTYSPASGIIKVFMNDVIVANWTDSNPIQSGAYISLRNGNCKAYYDDMKVFKSRSSTATVSVGNLSTKEARYQSPNSTQEACRVNSVVTDMTNNISSTNACNVKVDWTKPTTAVSITPTPTYITNDFTANFNDYDALSGIEKGYYQVLSMNSSNLWSGNQNRGFLGDNFDVLDTNIWKTGALQGSWNLASGMAVQTDENENNSNLYTKLNQTLSNRYLYHFNAKVEGSGTNRRFGFHYFADSGAMENRGNSYFVWFRLEYKTLEFYKVVNDNFTGQQKIISNITTVPGQLYDFKVIFDRITGKTDVFRNDTLLGSWTDLAPLTGGKYISFRSGNAKLSVDEVKVYRSRAASSLITVGNGAADDIQIEDPAVGVSSAKIKSIVIDSASNISSIYFYDLNVDLSAPSAVMVKDGPANDIDTTYTQGQLKANWTASSDINSGIANYWFAIGTTAGGTNICNWTNNGNTISVTKTGLTLVDGQIYYFSLKAENNAGLFSPIASSDGQLFLTSTSIKENENPYSLNVSPNPSSGTTNVSFYLQNEENVNIALYDNTGKLVYQITNNIMPAGSNKINLDTKKLGLSGGVYFLNFITKDRTTSVKLVVM
jgi:N-acetyl-anhydromuramyl-L-alanine amidase AmpD